MSWHTGAILIRGDHSADVVGLLDTLGMPGAVPGEPVSLEEASSLDNEGVAVGCGHGWTALWGCLPIWGVSEDGLAAVARSADVFWMLLEGASDTAGFAWWTGGKRVRDWLSQAGDAVKDEGKRLPPEKAAFAGRDHEQAVLNLMERLTLPYDQLESIDYRQYSVPDGDLFG
jgi:hypothetical protein